MGVGAKAAKGGGYDLDAQSLTPQNACKDTAKETKIDPEG